VDQLLSLFTTYESRPPNPDLRIPASVTIGGNPGIPFMRNKTPLFKRILKSNFKPNPVSVKPGFSVWALSALIHILLTLLTTLIAYSAQ
jgi:hypothetical protein